MLHFPANLSRLPIVPFKQKVDVDFEVAGLRRNAFSFKVTKKGDVLVFVAATSNRLNSGTAREQDGRIVIGRTHVVARGEKFAKRNHFTLHPAGTHRDVNVPVLHGAAGQFSRIPLDLRTITRRHLVMMHRLAAPGRYPLALPVDCSLCFGVLLDNGVPEFHLFVTPMESATSLDEPVPFVTGLSADFVMEPLRGCKHHLLFQLRFGFSDDYSISDHLLAVPTG